MTQPRALSIIDIDAPDAFARCANDPVKDPSWPRPRVPGVHEPAYARVLTDQGVQRWCHACVWRLVPR